ncbi:conserved hypothetical protein [Culex quinquefasciatus]|uniref:Tetraspanin n=1 Tax=Culex quinquefasciatus TaxID=7176 RepID=B0WVX6_CULQU|nr:conserved hypothetical protein [Culex quinquefasciatus]|eukprot:XP_001861548.1 conserved hypothetical protein [Culex quinquefasciatus]
MESSGRPCLVCGARRQHHHPECLSNLLAICGGAQLVIGAFLLWTHRQYSGLVNNQFWEPFGLIIALGLVSQLLCYLGWTSTSKKHRCYLGTFCAFLVALIVVQFLISGWAVAAKHQLITPAELAIESSFHQFISTDGASTDKTHIWNRLQRDYQCCGYSSIHDYSNRKRDIPTSCFDSINNKLYNVGCMHLLVKGMEANMIRVAIVAIVAALIQVSTPTNASIDCLLIVTLGVTVWLIGPA